jgi:hypothetical protein
VEQKAKKRGLKISALGILSDTYIFPTSRSAQSRRLSRLSLKSSAAAFHVRSALGANFLISDAQPLFFNADWSTVDFFKSKIRGSSLPFSIQRLQIRLQMTSLLHSGCI